MATNEWKDTGTRSSAVAGTAVDASTLEGNTVVVTGSISTSPAWQGTVVVEISMDGSTFVAAPGTSSFTNTAFSYQIPVPARQVRTRCSAYTAGSCVTYLGGQSLIK